MAFPERPFNRNRGAYWYIPTAVPTTRESSSNRYGFWMNARIPSFITSWMAPSIEYPRGKDDAGLRVDLLHPAETVPARHVRHDHVEEDQVDLRHRSRYRETPSRPSAAVITS